MSRTIRITTPMTKEQVRSLKAGDNVAITGTIYTGRDAAHKRMVDAIEKGDTLPFDPKGNIIYYVGPAPAKPGYAAGPAGPTTSYRMDPYTVPLLELGLAGMIGKGLRSKEVVNAMVQNAAVYFAAVGGVAALISKCIKTAEVVSYEDLGPEAVHRFYVEDFPAIVAIDAEGNSLYEIEPEKYRKP